MRRSFALFALLAVACGGPTEPPPSVVFITVDTLRADHLGTYGYFRDTSPKIDAFAKESVLFERALAPSATTLPSHTSLFTGTDLSRHGVLGNFDTYEQPVPTEGGGFQTAAQMFKAAGYTTAAFVSVYHLSHLSGIAAGFDYFDGMNTDRGGQALHLVTRTGSLTTERARLWLDSAPPEPLFLWVHYFDPHGPYSPPRGFAQMFPPDEGLRAFMKKLRIPPQWWTRALVMHGKYDGEVRYVDNEIGRLLEHLKEKGLYDDALIVLTADHGEGLGQHNEREHGVIWDEQLHVPLIMRFPNGRGPRPERRDDLVSLIDVLPTVASQLDLPFPTEQFDGIDVFRDEREYALAQREHSPKRYGTDLNLTLTGKRWKYHYHSEQDDALYDLEADPIEMHDVLEAHPKVAARMREEIIRQLAANAERGTALKLKRPPPEYEDALKSLGYVE